MSDAYPFLRPFESDGVLERWPQDPSDRDDPPDDAELDDLAAAHETAERFLMSSLDEFDDHDAPILAYEPFSYVSRDDTDRRAREYSVRKEDLKSKDLAGFVIGKPDVMLTSSRGWWIRVGAALAELDTYGIEPLVYVEHGSKLRYYRLERRGPIVVARKR